jgi:hypothetical protein
VRRNTCASGLVKRDKFTGAERQGEGEKESLLKTVLHTGHNGERNTGAAGLVKRDTGAVLVTRDTSAEREEEGEKESSLKTVLHTGQNGESGAETDDGGLMERLRMRLKKATAEEEDAKRLFLEEIYGDLSRFGSNGRFVPRSGGGEVVVVAGGKCSAETGGAEHNTANDLQRSRERGSSTSSSTHALVIGERRKAVNGREEGERVCVRGGAPRLEQLAHISSSTSHDMHPPKLEQLARIEKGRERQRDKESLSASQFLAYCLGATGDGGVGGCGEGAACAEGKVSRGREREQESEREREREREVSLETILTKSECALRLSSKKQFLELCLQTAEEEEEEEEKEKEEEKEVEEIEEEKKDDAARMKKVEEAAQKKKEEQEEEARTKQKEDVEARQKKEDQG